MRKRNRQIDKQAEDKQRERESVKVDRDDDIHLPDVCDFFTTVI